MLMEEARFLGILMPKLDYVPRPSNIRLAVDVLFSIAGELDNIP